MMHHFLTNFVKSGILGKVWNIPVHFSIHLNVFDYLSTIGLQATIEVVEVLDAAYLARSGIEELGRYGL